MTNKIILDPLLDAVASLDTAFTDYQKDGAEYTRDACIKRFEYSYELCHRMLKRYLENTSATPVEIDDFSFQGLIRLGYEKGILLNSWDEWTKYRDNRNKTSHGYNEKHALDIIAGLSEFLVEANYLIGQLQSRANND